VIAPDSSVVIAALATWHVAHTAAREALAEAEVGLVAQVAYETTSALSRMPEGRRIAPDVVLDALNRRFPADWLALKGPQARSALTRAVAAGVRGAALHDALIAATAQQHEARIVSANLRAKPAYDAIEAEIAYLRT